ncbi:MAG: hypothetical protein QOJ79_1339 [Actinomycetota bacterium]|nr:hypothetical protein [Actinomycetota bacterium]
MQLGVVRPELALYPAQLPQRRGGTTGGDQLDREAEPRLGDAARQSAPGAVVDGAKQVRAGCGDVLQLAGGEPEGPLGDRRGLPVVVRDCLLEDDLCLPGSLPRLVAGEADGLLRVRDSAQTRTQSVNRLLFCDGTTQRMLSGPPRRPSTTNLPSVSVDTDISSAPPWRTVRSLGSAGVT